MEDDINVSTTKRRVAAAVQTDAAPRALIKQHDVAGDILPEAARRQRCRVIDFMGRTSTTFLRWVRAHAG